MHGVKAMNDNVRYFVTYVDANGKKHYAINIYNRVLGLVTMVEDFKFKNCI